MTAQDIVTAGLTLCGRLGAGRTPGKVESNVSFDVLQRLMESLGLKRTYIYLVRSDLYTIAGGFLSGTLGTDAGGNPGSLGGTRPVFIESANLVTTYGSATLREEIEIVDADKWAAVETQADESLQVGVLYPDYGFPLCTVFINPRPENSAQLELYTWQQLQAFATLADVFAMPPGYARYLKCALAIALAATFHLSISDELQTQHDQAEAAVIARNLKLPGGPPAPVPAAKPEEEK